MYWVYVVRHHVPGYGHYGLSYTQEEIGELVALNPGGQERTEYYESIDEGQ